MAYRGCPPPDGGLSRFRHSSRGIPRTAAAGNKALSVLFARQKGSAELGTKPEATAFAVQRGILDVIGDVLNVRTDEARLDAEEDLSDFRKQTFSKLRNHKPSSGLGQFDVAFDPGAGKLNITLKVSYKFVNGSPGAVAPGFRPAEFAWSPAEKADWKARYQKDVGAQWSTKHRFKSTRPHWTSMVVDTTVAVIEDADPHFILTVSKYPSDAEMVQSSICPPGTSHDPTGAMCPANPPDASGVTPGYGSGRFDVNDLRPEQKLDWSNPTVSVPFEKTRTALTTAGTATLAPVLVTLKSDPSAHAELVGRASSDHHIGVSPADGAIANMDLARARSAAVQAALVAGGIPAERILIRNQGEQGATSDPIWCRVDVQLGTHEMQNPALHETGHMMGLGDEYPQTGAPAGSPVAAGYDAMIKSQTGQTITRASNQDAMSVGSTVQPWHYSSFLEALKAISRLSDWSL